MRSFLGGVVVALVVVCGVTFLVINRGWIPIGADNPPGALERRLAHMATDAYVARNAPRQENPVQPAAASLGEGARAYEKNCALCHGGFGQRISPLRTKFSPPVPQIVNRVPHDEDANLWWITKHGTRLTGMPAWDGILSDDEIWKIIAFVKHSDKLPPEAQAAWRQAAAGPAATGGAPPPPQPVK
jgi:mono/diheme cytochrome c family protein